ADRTIGKQAFDIALPDRAESADQHRENRNDNYHLLPFMTEVLERTARQEADEQNQRRQFRYNGEIGGDPPWHAFLYIPRPHMERSGGSLEGKTGDYEDQSDGYAF